MDSEIFFRKV